MRSVEESKDNETLTIDELQSSIPVHEQRMRSHIEEERALKIIMEINTEEGVEVMEVLEEEVGEEADKALIKPHWSVIC